MKCQLIQYTTNHISKTLRGLDDIPAFGLLLQILLLQGLIKWFENVDLKEGNNGYNEACELVKWIAKLLVEKEIRFCYYRWGDDDKEYLKPFCNYLLSTEIGKAVQNSLFEKQLDCSCIIDEHGMKKAPNEPEDNKEVADEPDLPNKITHKESLYFEKAIKAGLMEQSGNGYRWLHNGGLKASLGYFLNRIFNPKGTAQIPYRYLETLFGVTRLDTSIDQALNPKKPQKWRKDIDPIFDD